MNFRTLSAVLTGWPRTVSATRRHFCGDMRAWRSFADTSMGASLGRSLDLLVARMGLEGARGGEFAKLVTDHVLGHQHRNVLLAVVHGNRQANHVGHDH